jgi:hypothetical protein
MEKQQQQPSSSKQNQFQSSKPSKNQTQIASPKVEHQFFTKMTDINTIENDLIKLLNDFSNTRLKKYGNCFKFKFI